MSSLLKFCIIFLMLLPITIFSSIGGENPIELVYSDIFLAIAILIYLVRSLILVRKTRLYDNLVPLLAFTFFVFVVYPMFGIMFFHGDIVWFLSALKFSKIFLIPILAIVVFNMCKLSLTNIANLTAIASAVLILILFVSDILYSSNFPSPRWGGKFLDFDVYGFPNSAAVFYLVPVSFVFSGVTNKDNTYIVRLFYFIVFLLGSLIIVFSLSRAALFSYAIFVILVVILHRSASTYFVLFSLLITAIIGAFFYSSDVKILLFTLYEKIVRIFEDGATFSNRTNIWAGTISLILQKPIFGYLFEPFANYGLGYSTPHQQYLEVLYKSGIVGFVLYVNYFLFLFSRNLKVLGMNLPDIERNFIKVFLIVFLAILFSNLSQPSLSYSVLGNVMVFFLSYISLFVQPRSSQLQGKN